MQLPPTLSGVDAPSGGATAGVQTPGDLSKTLFTRLANTGITTSFLTRQYRCHPVAGCSTFRLPDLCRDTERGVKLVVRRLLC